MYTLSMHVYEQKELSTGFEALLSAQHTLQAVLHVHVICICTLYIYMYIHVHVHCHSSYKVHLTIIHIHIHVHTPTCTCIVHVLFTHSFKEDLMNVRI